jgi:hypothetical protein
MLNIQQKKREIRQKTRKSEQAHAMLPLNHTLF